MQSADSSFVLSIGSHCNSSDMVKRDASSQDTLDRSPKRTQLIDLVSDSDSELPDLDFSRFNARSQRARESGQGKYAVPRDTWLVKPKARRVENEQDEEDEEKEEVEPELGLELMDDHTAGRQATVESEAEEHFGSAMSNVRHGSRPLEMQPSDPRPETLTSDTRDDLGDALSSDNLDQEIELTQSRTLCSTPKPAEAVAIMSPTMGAVDTRLTGPDRSHPTRDSHDRSCDAGPSNRSSVATASINTSDARVLSALHEARVLSALHEALATNCSTVDESNSVSLAPTVTVQSPADQNEEIDNELALEPQDQEDSVENEPHRSEQPLEENDDLEDDGCDNNIISILVALLIQLSEHSSARIAEERNLNGSGSEQGTRQSIQNVQPTRTRNRAEIDVVRECHTPSPVARTPETRNHTLPNVTLPQSGALQGQRSHQQTCIEGGMRFTNCDQVNIGPNIAQSDGTLPTDGGQLAPIIIKGDLVFEGCKVVNIFTPSGPMPSVHKRQHSSHQSTRRPGQSARKRPRP